MIISKKDYFEVTNRLIQEISEIKEKNIQIGSNILTRIQDLSDSALEHREKLESFEVKSDNISEQTAELSVLIRSLKEDNERHIDHLIDLIDSLRKESISRIDSISDQLSQLSEAVNMLMVQHLLDKAETMPYKEATCTDKINPQGTDNVDSPPVRIRCLSCGSTLKGNRVCGLCGYFNE